MESKTQLFFDSSTLIAAASSPVEGFSRVVDSRAQGHVVAVVTRLMLREAERNIKGKMAEQALVRFCELLGGLDPGGHPPSLIRRI